MTRPNPSAYDRSGRDTLLLASLLAGQTLAEAAEAAQLSERQARRRVNRPAFRAQLRELESEALAAVSRQLTADCLRARERLAELVESPDERTALQASRWTLSLALDAHESVTTARRIEEIERVLDQIEGKEKQRWPT